MKYTTEMIVDKLKSYPMKKAQLTLLQFEMTRPAKISEHEMLEVMAYGTSGNGSDVRGSGPNLDRTLGLALSYRNAAQAMNEDVKDSMLCEWNQLHMELEQLDFYMGLLKKEQQEILRLSYIERMTWQEMERETGYSRRTLVRRRNEAVERLTEMYNYTSNLTSK